MRRIPRPRRAIDPSLPLQSISRLQLNSASYPCVASPYPYLRTTSASFSTTPTLSFILGKQDKKKHQAFVRRWQKRLLGDSEPIGAHVDPYDPTSPVRIAPEEQGEEVEVLEEVALTGETENPDLGPIYEEAASWHRLRHVGGQQWIEQIEESKLAKEFEKLTLRTYTPLDLKMADHIEDLTGSMYTLRDENLMMATAFHEFTGKPYTDWSFGRRTRSRDVDSIRKNFRQAVTEVYALKQAGKDVDVSKLPSRGIYEVPEWVKEATLQMSANNDISLSWPAKGGLDSLLEKMLRVPEWEPELQRAAPDRIPGDSEADIFEEEPPPPMMDPEIPAFKRAALVKQNPEKRFDFMSNRPVPRSPPETPIAQPAATEAEATVDMQPKPASGDKETTVGIVVKAVDGPAPAQSTINRLEASTSASEEGIAVLRQAIHEGVATSHRKSTDQDSSNMVELKWRDIPLTDVKIKFALTKRVTQLTGLYITDPNISAANTLGELYHHFSVAANPEVSKVYKFIQVEGAKQNHKAKQIVEHERTSTGLQSNRPTVGELLKLGNVKVYSKRPTAKDERRKIGLHKAIGRELRQRNLLGRNQPTSRCTSEQGREDLSRWKEMRIIEGTQVAPQPGTVVALGAAHVLKERTARMKRGVSDAQ